MRSSMSFWGRLPRALGAGIGAAAVTAALWYFGWLRPLGRLLVDLQSRFLAVPAPAAPAASLVRVLESNALLPVPVWLVLAFLLLIAVVGACTAGYTVRAGWRTLGLVLLIAVPVAAGVAGSWLLGLPIDSVPVLCAAGLGFIGGAIASAATEGRERREFARDFRGLVHPALVEGLVHARVKPRLHGEERVVTVLAAQLADLAAVARALPPSELVGLIGEHARLVRAVVMEHGGTLDDLAGDRVTAVWNAPVAQPDHAARAAAAALAVGVRLGELNRRLPAGRPRRATRIGLATGPAVIGDIGTGERFRYTVLGAPAGLAVRLGDVNRIFGTAVAVSADTAAALGDAFLVRELDLVRVEGEPAPVPVFELVSRTADATPVISARLERFALALISYRQRQFNAALAFFEDLDQDPPARAYVQRCLALRAAPPPADWDGVFELFRE